MKGNEQLEREANYFAMCLLMPEHLVRQEVKKVKLDLTDDTASKTAEMT